MVDTGRFDFGGARGYPRWVREIYAAAGCWSETEEYSIRSFVYGARRSFDPARLHAFIRELSLGVIRAKGPFRLATWPDGCGEFS